MWLFKTCGFLLFLLLNDCLLALSKDGKNNDNKLINMDSWLIKMILNNHLTYLRKLVLLQTYADFCL